MIEPLILNKAFKLGWFGVCVFGWSEVIDMMLVQHSLGPADMEINATLCFAWCYLV